MCIDAETGKVMATKSKNDQNCTKNVVSFKKYCFNVQKLYNSNITKFWFCSMDFSLKGEQIE